MKKLSLKSFIAGLILGLVGITTLVAANGIRSAEYKDIKVTLDGETLSLNNQLVAIVDESNPSVASTYMPMRELLETLGYKVNWYSWSNTIALESNVLLDGNATTIVKHDTIVAAKLDWSSALKYSISIDEDPSTDIKWQFAEVKGLFSSDSDPTLTFANDEYVDEGDSSQKAIHRFNFSITKPFGHDLLSITFEQVLDGKKTGNKIVYNVEFQPVSIDKPVIYLYPEEKTDVTVSLDFDGVLDYTYPAYDNGWSVTAYPDGTIINHKDNREYSYLFWEGHGANNYDFSKGFVVKGSDTINFLQEKLAYMGLTPKEYNEFIVYWLPKMQDNPYNLITFQGDAYTDTAKLTVSPKPDSVLRVFMTFKAIDEPIELPQQILTPFERKGFTVIEWGGSEIK